MLWLKKHSDNIRALLNEGSPQALTYAALECRLGIERICYERLRIAHKYISAKDIGRWQPKDVVNILLQEVDKDIASSLILSISETPVSGKKDLTPEEYAKLSWIEVGRQAGFDAQKLGRLWNALGSFLHVRLPRSSTDAVEPYSDPNKIGSKIADVLAEFALLENATLMISGMGEIVSFECACGTTNSRRSDLLISLQTVSCISPNCEEKWTVHKVDEDIEFERQLYTVRCSFCSHAHEIPKMALWRQKHEETSDLICDGCGKRNQFSWRLMQAHQRNSIEALDDLSDGAGI